MRLLGAILSILLLFGCSGGSETIQRTYIDQSVLRNALQSTVAIIANRNESDVNSATVECTGFFVDRTTIVSALHCFQNIVRIQIPEGIITLPTRPDPTGTMVQFVRYGEIDHISRQFQNNIINEAIVLRIDRDRDIAVLQITPETRESEHYVMLANRTPNVTERVFLIGHPMQMVWTVGDGIVSRNVIVGDQLGYIQATVGLIGGYSGGPLLDIDGNVIGMANFFLGQMHHISMFVSAQRITNVILNR